MSEETVDVMFRKPLDGSEVYALFPGLPGTQDPDTCLCYEHIGQHSAANLARCIHSSRVAKPEEYGELQKELERVGYKLKVVFRSSLWHYNARVSMRDRIAAGRKEHA